MEIAKPAYLVLTGVVLGSLAVSSVNHATAAQQNPASRLVFTSAPSNRNAKMYFVLDTKSRACWLASLELEGHGNAVALAVAPTEACQ
jgi:hypothetical protein